VITLAYEPLTKEDYAIAASNGISRTTAYRRYEDLYWSKEETITKKPKPRKQANGIIPKKEIVLTKEEYAIALENGISPQTAYSRRERLKWPVEKCITEPVQESVKWEDWKEVAEKAGITYMGFWKRIKKGMKPDQAATMPNKRKSLCS
jgi:hypothetical protein